MLPATSATVAFIWAMAVATWAISCCWLWIPGMIARRPRSPPRWRPQLGHGGGHLLDEPTQVVLHLEGGAGQHPQFVLPDVLAIQPMGQISPGTMALAWATYSLRGRRDLAGEQVMTP